MHVHTHEFFMTYLSPNQLDEAAKLRRVCIAGGVCQSDFITTQFN